MSSYMLVVVLVPERQCDTQKRCCAEDGEDHENVKKIDDLRSLIGSHRLRLLGEYDADENEEPHHRHSGEDHEPLEVAGEDFELLTRHRARTSSP